MSNRNTFASIAMIHCKLDGGIPTVKDPKQKLPILWKFPGGNGKDGETPEECALREVKEETGIDLKQYEYKIKLLEVEKKPGLGLSEHTKYFFLIELNIRSSDLTLAKRGIEGEWIKIRSANEILRMSNFLRGHVRLGKETLQEYNWSDYLHDPQVA